ncbi:GT2 family glycosyltransferase [Paenibacillus sp. JGP012]|uniref:glycosyltransferase n=1 Tax=Paenibacillus sp. JGP012 TaxID=2735914 RepID=UPI00161839FC|nr:glycosyltransferase [Paenibacillus sp. JGP012]MBB6024671.1 GT2 family glycosyltransferase [Paenibacillus sp. JGP012]
MSDLKSRVHELEAEREKLRLALNNYKSKNEDLCNTLDQIYNSTGWKMLSLLYKWRDRINLYLPIRRKRNIPVKLEEKLNESELVSIIIPIYNNSEYLEKCLESALNQTHEHIEVIAYDDCSTDEKVWEICEKFIDNKRFKYYKNDVNSGISQTMNNAIIKANGDWIAFLDCDDWLELNAVELLLNKLQETPGSLYGYTDRVNEDEGTGLSRIETFRNRATSNYYEELLKGMFTTHLKMIHKSVFVKIGLHESRFDGAQDYDIALKTAFHFGDAFAYLSAPVYHHRIHTKQTTIETADRISHVVNTIKSEARMRQMIREGTYETLVSFVILSFEKKDMTLKCVESIQNTVNIPYEIIIFDNASSLETKEFIKQNIEILENVTVHYSDENLGCPGGRRKATKMAKGDYVINLDNDIVVTNGWIEELLVRAEQNENIGAVCCKTVFPNGEIQFNGGTFIESEDFLTFLLTHSGKQESQVETALWLECDWVPGGATLFKKTLVEKLDYSPDYKNAFEDNDVALQIRKLGYTMYNCPTSKVYHYHFMFNDEPQKEKRYMESRYKEQSFIISFVNFYRRNNKIINDQFIFRLIGLEGKSHEEIKRKVKELQIDIFEKIG